MADADVIVVGAGLAGSGRCLRARRPGPARPDRRPGERGQHRWPGVLVVRRPLLRRQPRAAAPRHSRQPRARAAGLARHRRIRPHPRTTGRGNGRTPTSTSRRGRSAAGCATGGCRPSPWSAGPSAVATTPAGTATRYRASTSPGARGPRSSTSSRDGCTRPAGAVRAPAPRRRTHRRRRRGRRGARRGAGTVARPRGACRRHETSLDDFEFPRSGRHRRQWRDRRQSRPGPQELARADGPGPRTAAQRRPRPRRRPDARHLARPRAAT